MYKRQRPVDGGDGPGEHLGPVSVGHGLLQSRNFVGEGEGGRPVERRRHHRARCAALPHQPASFGGEAQTVRQGQSSGRVQRGVLPDAVPGHGVWFDVGVAPQPDEGALQGEQRGLRGFRASERPLPRYVRRVGRPQCGEQGVAGEVAVVLLAGVEHVAYCGVTRVEGVGHSGVLAALPGELERHERGALS